MTDLHALVAERCAEKINAGKRPSKADLEWLEAVTQAVPHLVWPVGQVQAPFTLLCPVGQVQVPFWQVVPPPLSEVQAVPFASGWQTPFFFFFLQL